MIGLEFRYFADLEPVVVLSEVAKRAFARFDGVRSRKDAGARALCAVGRAEDVCHFERLD